MYVVVAFGPMTPASIAEKPLIFNIDMQIYSCHYQSSVFWILMAQPWLMVKVI